MARDSGTRARHHRGPFFCRHRHLYRYECRVSTMAPSYLLLFVLFTIFITFMLAEETIVRYTYSNTCQENEAVMLVINHPTAE